jgi:hypothetical protein
VSAGIPLACPCGEVWELKPEYAGVLLECPVCGRHLRAPRPGARPATPADLDPAFDRDVFLLNQRTFTIASQYEVVSEDGTPVAYVERPTYPVRTAVAWLAGFVAASITVSWAAPLLEGSAEALGGLFALVLVGLTVATFAVVMMSVRPLRHVSVYRDDGRREPLLGIVQEQRVAVLVRTYRVVTPAGEPLARLRKVYVHNLVRKRWYVESAADSAVSAADSAVSAADRAVRPAGSALAIEDSIVLSLLRRVLGSFFGLLRTNFVVQTAGGEVLGEFNRKFTVFDRYVLDLRADVERRLDRRIALALGIMLDTGERR